MLLVAWALPSGPENASNLGVPALGSGIGSGAGVVIEAVITFFLVWVVFATAVDPRGAFKQISGLAIGFTIAMGVLMAYGLTGGAMNPARAFGPQLVGRSLGALVGLVRRAVRGRGDRGGRCTSCSTCGPQQEVEAAGTPESGIDEPRPGDAAAS